MYFVLFFKQKTAFEMRISDWSSDVCSSDLLHELFPRHGYDQAIIFGHAKDGNLHFVVTQAFDTPEKTERYRAFIEDVVTMVVKKYDGALKAEHGTGRNMAPFVETEWGGEINQIMKAHKQ